jgi:hypothetical protein
MEAGAFPLTSVGSLPNVTVAYPGEVLSRERASGSILPGEAVMPVSSGGAEYVRRAVDADKGDPRLGIALRPVEHPDVNTGPSALGPNEIVNQVIPQGEYVRRYRTGGFLLTLVEPRADWAHGDLIAFDVDGVRPAGKPAGTGSWVRTATVAEAFAEVIEFRPYSEDGDEGVLLVRTLQGTSM